MRRDRTRRAPCGEGVHVVREAEAHDTWPAIARTSIQGSAASRLPALIVLRPTIVAPVFGRCIIDARLGLVLAHCNPNPLRGLACPIH